MRGASLLFGGQLQQQEIRRMAMMISQTQLSSKRLQKQLFIFVPPFDRIDREGHCGWQRPSVIILCGKDRKVTVFCRILRKAMEDRRFILTFLESCGKIVALDFEIETEDVSMMRILAIGDVVGSAAVEYLNRSLWDLRKKEKIDFVVANGENATDCRGVLPRDADVLLATGVDLITLGNHTYGMREIYPYLDDAARVIRPANYPPTAPGCGYTIVRADGARILCINISGRVFMDPLASPFDTVDRILEREKGSYDFALMDIHAEATSEKLALAHYFDGRIAVMFGTHTHVQTADEQILPHGSGYITDLGMCGPENGILGTERETVIERFRTMMPARFHVADGKIVAHGAIFDVDPDAGRVKSVKRIVF